MKLHRLVTVFLDTDLRSYWYRNGGLASALYVSSSLGRLPRTLVLKGKKVDHNQRRGHNLRKAGDYAVDLWPWAQLF